MFDLNSIKKTKRITAPKIVIVGPGKIGKTTFASQAQDSVGILTEDGSSSVDTHAFPLCESIDDVYSCIKTLLFEDHGFKNVFIDSLDWLEPLLWKKVCAENKWESIEQPGFGKGYVECDSEWRQLLSGLDELRNTRGMGVTLICHEKIATYKNPMTESYNLYTLKLQDRATAIIKEWADVLGFATHKILTSTNTSGFGGKEVKAKTAGDNRILHVEPHPAHCAGNRFGLQNMPLDRAVFDEQLAAVFK